MQNETLSQQKKILLEKWLQGNVRAKKPSEIPRQVNLTGRAIMSFAQQRLWFLDQIDPGKSVYNMPAAIRLLGEFDFNILKKALNEIVRRHQVLRTNFAVVDDMPLQLVAEDFELTIPVIDLSKLPEDARKLEMDDLVRTEVYAPFNLSRGPLIRVSLVRLQNSEHVILFAMHHIISDGWSMAILIRELTIFYRAISFGANPSLDELPIQYADYAHWQREWLKGEVLTLQIAYWTKKLADAPTLLALPTDRPRPLRPTYQGSKVEFVISSETATGLQNLANQNNATLFMVLATAFNVLLARHSGQTDICVGTPIANRNRLEIEALIGFFVNTLVLRTSVDLDATFNELLRQVASTALEAYAHQDVPFEKIVDAVRPERHTSYAPLFQVMLVLHNTPKEELKLSGVTLEVIDIGGKTARYDLTLDISEDPDGLRGSFEYSTDLFDRSTVERMAGHFCRLLDEVVLQKNDRVGELPMLRDIERHQLIVGWNESTVEYPACETLVDIFERQAALTPENIAVVCGQQLLTYRDLSERVNLLARQLRAQGVRHNALVGIFVERSIEMVVSLLGILKSGGAYLPLDPAHPTERINYILCDAKPTLLLTQQSLLEKLDVKSLKTLCLDMQGPSSNEDNFQNLPHEVKSHHLAYVIYTSGSTGKPKGVQLLHGGLTNFLRAMTDAPGIHPADRVLAITTLSFDISVLELFLPLIVGASSIILTKEETRDVVLLADRIQTFNPTVIQATPATWRMLLGHGWRATKNQKLLAGGEVLDYQMANQLRESGCELWNMYGPTEATVWASVFQVKEINTSAISVPIGRPIANTKMYVLDKYLQPTPVGVHGELHIGGIQVACGYLNREALTEEKFIPDPFSGDQTSRLYKTGDLVRYLANGQIEFLGRVDHQIKLNGFRIEPGEIESILVEHPAIRQAVVIVREDVKNDKRLVAYIIPQNDADIEHLPSILRKTLGESLPAYMVPTSFSILHEFPLTENGKVDRNSLPRPDQGLDNVTYVPARTDTEERLCEIWSDILGVAEVGRFGNFFDLGGHSLLAIRLTASIFEIFGVRMPLKCVFSYPVLESQAQKLDELIVEVKPIETKSRSENADQFARMALIDEFIPISFVQHRLLAMDENLLLDKLSSVAWNISFCLSFEGSASKGRLVGALETLIERHSALRTSFYLQGGGVFQRIHPREDVEIEVVNCSEAKALEDIRAIARTPFQLSEKPPIRVCVFAINANKYLLAMVIHHLNFDGSSFAILAKDFKDIYAGKDVGGEIPAQYAHFVMEQHQLIKSKSSDYKTLLSYWEPLLWPPSPRLVLNFYPEILEAPYKSALRSFSVAKETIEKIQTSINGQPITAFVSTIAAYFLTVFSATSQSDVTVSLPVTSRTRSDWNSIIGFLADTQLMRINLEKIEAKTLEDFVLAVNELAIGMLCHQDLPHPYLMSKFQSDLGMKYIAPFNLRFAFQNFARPDIRLDGIDVGIVDVGSSAGGSTRDIALYLEEGIDGSLSGTMQFNKNLISDEHMTILIKRFVRILDELNNSSSVNLFQFLTELRSIE